MDKTKIKKITDFSKKHNKKKKSVLFWKWMDTQKEETVPYGREVLFIPDAGLKAASVIFTKENDNTRLYVDHTLCLQYEGSGIWAEMPEKKDIRDAF